MEKELQELGLEEKEAELYLACLKVSLTTPTQLARRTGLKRATIYFHIEKLEAKGLVAFEVRGARKYITALPPKQGLKKYISAKKEQMLRSEEIIKDLVAELEKLPEEGVSNSRVFHYEGEDGIRFALDKILSLKQDLYWLGSIETLLGTVGERQLHNLFTLKRLAQETTAYAITDRRILKYPQFSQMIGNTRAMRFLDGDFTVPTVLGFAGDTIFLLSRQKSKIQVVIIENELMCQAVKFLFSSLWAQLSKA